MNLKPDRYAYLVNDLGDFQLIIKNLCRFGSLNTCNHNDVLFFNVKYSSIKRKSGMTKNK